jgi:hypothetical protein
MIRHSDSSEASIGSLFKDLTEESRTLLKQEMELAKAEIGEKASIFGRNFGYLAAGGAILFGGFLVLIATACIGLAVALSRVVDGEIAAWLGPLIVGVAVCIVGYVVVQKAIATLKSEGIVPRKTIDSLRENSEWFKDHMTALSNRATNHPTMTH